MKNSRLKIFVLLMILSASLFGRSSSEVVETVEVSLDSFGMVGIIIMIGLSSLLGAFFVKDDISEAFKQ